jgi:hypothetical protein
MKNKLILSLFVILFNYGEASSEISKVMEAENSNDSYTLVYVDTSNAGSKAARKAILKRAAETTVDHGYRYFVIDSEEAVMVSYSGEQLPADSGYFPDNLDEVIIQRNFGKRSTSSSPESYPGYQIIFHFSQDSHLGKTKDACKYAPCEN